MRTSFHDGAFTGVGGGGSCWPWRPLLARRHSALDASGPLSQPAWTFVLRVLFLLSSFAWPLHAQSTTNRVLELDGKGSYVELPSDIFNDLTEATVEGWVKWDQFGQWSRFSRFFDFGKQGQEMNLGNSDGDPNLCLEIRDSKGEWPVNMKVSDCLKAGRWCHLAVVTGPRGVKLYLDGALRETSTYTGSFAAIGDGSRNYLGRNNWKESAPFVTELQGQIDEVRVWNYARTTEQIRESLFTTLTGHEPGLVGYWNFDDGTVNDLAPGHHHGQAVGNVKFTAAQREYHLLTG